MLPRSLAQIRRDRENKIAWEKMQIRIKKFREMVLHTVAAIISGFMLGFAITVITVISMNAMKMPAIPVMAVLVTIGLCFILQLTAQRYCGNHVMKPIAYAFYVPFWGTSMSTLFLIISNPEMFGF
jgi:hypothetical protein